MSGTEFYSPLDASERILANGRPLAPREFVTLSQEEQEDPHNARLIAEGQLIPAVHVEQSLSQLRAQAAEMDIKGRGNMNKEEIIEAIDAKMENNAEQATDEATAKEANQ